ncbi:hypothetical protein TNCV_3235681 [Trichonephila clavipes]|nr:hypothetical protein TNCV_3235681 [Trichonephila clavipes]
MRRYVPFRDRHSVSYMPLATLQSASPSRIIAGDDHIAEFSDLFREAIQARNVYAAWARKLTNARPNDPKLQSYHQEVTKAGESVELIVKLNVPLFRIPASEKELDKIILRVKNRVSDPPAEKNDEAKKPAAVSPPHPVLRVERRNEASMLTASLPQATC